MKKSSKPLRFILLIAGIILAGLTIFMLTRNNLSLGVVLPGLLGLPLILYGIFQKKLDPWFSQGFGKVVKWIFIIGYLFLIAIFTIFGVMMNMAAHTQLPEKPDVIMVLGAALHNGNEPSDVLKRRIDRAMEYAEQYPQVPVLVTGGKGLQEDVTEASAMKQYLIGRGMDENRILVEDKATSTRENFANSKLILDERFGKNNYTTVFATSDFHILRAQMTAEAAGFTNVYGLPVQTLIYTAPAAYGRESLALLATYVFGVVFD